MTAGFTSTSSHLVPRSEKEDEVERTQRLNGFIVVHAFESLQSLGEKCTPKQRDKSEDLVGV